MKRVAKEVLRRVDHLRKELQEHFLVFTINSDNKILHDKGELVYIGNQDESPGVDHKDVFRPIFIDKAPSVIFVHNHPLTDDPEASKDDKDLQRDLWHIANKHLDVDIIDHLIITKNNHYSFAEHKILKGRKKRRKRKAQ